MRGRDAALLYAGGNDALTLVIGLALQILPHRLTGRLLEPPLLHRLAEQQLGKGMEQWSLGTL